MDRHPGGWQDPDEYTYWVDCNSKWAEGWGIFGVLTWIPLIFGAIGTMMVNPMVLEVVGFPRNFLQHGHVVKETKAGRIRGNRCRMPWFQSLGPNSD